MSSSAHELYDEDSILKAMSICVDNIEVGIYVTDFYSGEVLFVNRKISPFAGVSDPKSMLGKPCWETLNVQGAGRCSFCPYKKLLDKNGNPTGPYAWELHLEHLGLWIKVINQAIIWIDGRLVHMVTCYDITRTKHMQEQLSNLAFRDRLLGLKNEISIEKDLQVVPVKPSLLLVDILSLQRINEAYGRELGDHLLKSVSEWIMNLNIPASQLYRIGGDEFCLAVEDISKDDLTKLSATLSSRFLEPWTFDHNGNMLRIFCSASIAIILSEYIQDSMPLLNLIERTLKTAKEKKSIVVYDKIMDTNYRDCLQLELSLKQSVRDGMKGFDVFYQPIIDSESETWRGLEALCRWNSPDLGPIPPILFIPEAERLELIGAIGLWVLETAVCNCKKLGLDSCEGFILDVNVSAAQFCDKTLADKILGILKNYDFPGNRLCLEITESTQFTFTDEALNTIIQLKEYNILVALDDFGTGYSSFNSLKSLPVDILKIERIFVDTIEHDEYHQDLFHAIAVIAHAAHKKLVVEGVERISQLQILTENDADYLQGYLFSEPLPLKVLEKSLNNFHERVQIKQPDNA